MAWVDFYRIGPLGRFDLVVAMSVCLSVCLCVWCPFLRGIFWGLFCPHFPRSDVQNFRDLEFFGKSAGKKWSQNWNFLLGCGVKSPRQKKFFLLLILPYKTWWKPASRWIRNLWSKGISLILASLDVFEFLRFIWFFLFKKKIGFWGILGPPSNSNSHSVRLAPCPGCKWVYCSMTPAHKGMRRDTVT